MFVVPKEGGGGRLIIDCSKPHGGSVNCHFDKIASKFKYLSVDNILDCLQPGDFLASIDIKDTY